MLHDCLRKLTLDLRKHNISYHTNNSLLPKGNKQNKYAIVIDNISLEVYFSSREQQKKLTEAFITKDNKYLLISWTELSKDYEATLTKVISLVNLLES